MTWGQCIFQLGATIKDKEINSRVKWLWVIMDTCSLDFACQTYIMAGELKILETNFKSEEIIHFYLVFLHFFMCPVLF